VDKNKGRRKIGNSILQTTFGQIGQASNIKPPFRNTVYAQGSG